MSFLIRKTTNCNSHARETLNTFTFHVNYPTKKPWLPQKYTQQQSLDAFKKKKKTLHHSGAEFPLASYQLQGMDR